MENSVIRAFARPCGTLLYLQVGCKTGKARFLARSLKLRSVEEIPLSKVAMPEVLAEICTKSVRHMRYGYALLTVMVSADTKDFINACWDELKQLKPQLAIKSS